MIEFGHLTHVGSRRKLNEDTYYGDNELGLWLVVDGMGGPERGEMASALIREAIVQKIRSGAKLTDAIQTADTNIRQTMRQCSSPTGGTVVATHIRQYNFETAWVGDSRAYCWQNQRLIPIEQTTEPIIAAAPYLTDLSSAPLTTRTHTITQALGITDPALLKIATATGQLDPGMQLLLCSDGLTEEVNDYEINEIIRQQTLSAQECVDLLVATALNKGGADNITVILIRAH